MEAHFGKKLQWESGLVSTRVISKGRVTLCARKTSHKHNNTDLNCLSKRRDLLITFSTCPGLVSDVTDTDCWAQKFTHGCVFATLKRWFKKKIANRKWVKNCCMYLCCCCCLASVLLTGSVVRLQLGSPLSINPAVSAVRCSISSKLSAPFPS